MIYTLAENRHWHTVLAVDHVFEIKVPHKARFLSKRRIKFKKKFVISA